MKLSEKAFKMAHKILNLSKRDEAKTEIRKGKTIDDKRIIGQTDYKKFEELANEIEIEDFKESDKGKEVLKTGCNNDMRKERQLLERPSKYKLEAAQLFKYEGDDFLKEKNWSEALNAYEKGLLQLFYTFSDDKEEDQKVDAMKSSISMNMSVCHINTAKWVEAISSLNEALRVDSNNLKALYRIAYCYFNANKYDDCKKYIESGLKLQPNSEEFSSLKNQVEEKCKSEDDKRKQFFQKAMANN